MGRLKYLNPCKEKKCNLFQRMLKQFFFFNTTYELFLIHHLYVKLLKALYYLIQIIMKISIKNLQRRERNIA